MARVLSISSQVAYGHVGNSVTAFLLQRLGHEVFSVPTVILSNRPDYPAVGGIRIASDVIEEMLEAGLANGWLNGIDAIMTGYLPSPAHVELAARWVERLKADCPGLYFLCDPVLGDEPGGIYIDEAAACTVRDRLLGLADLTTPNRFELGWLTSRRIETAGDAIAAAHALRVPAVIATSAPAPDGRLANLLVEGVSVCATGVTRRALTAHGTGDFLAAALLARLLDGSSLRDALGFATAAMEAAIAATGDAGELALISSQSEWASAAPLPCLEVDDSVPL